jgi:hypothetical protein
MNPLAKSASRSLPMLPRPAARVRLCLALAGLALTVGGCKSDTQSSYSTSQWATSHSPTIRHGVGDSLGNALFLRQVQLAKSAQFQGAPVYAAETTE